MHSDENDSNDDNEGKREEVVEDGEDQRGKNQGRGQRRLQSASLPPFFLLILTVFDRKKALGHIREDVLPSTAPLPKEATMVHPPPSFVIDFLHFLTQV